MGDQVRFLRTRINLCVAFAAPVFAALISGCGAQPEVEPGASDELTCLAAMAVPVPEQARMPGEERARITVFNHCSMRIRARVNVSNTFDSSCQSFDFGAYIWDTPIGIAGRSPKLQGVELCS